MSNKLFYRLGLEDLIEDTPADEPETLEEMAGESTPEADILKADEQGEVLEQDQADVEGVSNDTETMEEVVKGLESALKSGNPSKDAIVFSNMAINAVNKRWFGKPGLSVSTESITSPEEAIVASMEGALDKVKELGRAFIEKLKKMWNTFTSWIKSVFDGSAKLSARAAALAKKAGEAKDVGEVKFEDSDQATLQAIKIDGKVDESGIKTGIQRLSMLSMSLEASAVIAADMGAIGQKAISGDGKAAPEGFAKLNEAFVNVLKPVGGMVEAKDAKWAPEGATVGQGKSRMPGDNYLYIVMGDANPKDLGDAARVFAKYKFTIKPVGADDDKIDAAAVKPETVKALGTALVGVCDKIGSYKKTYAQREHLRGLVIKQLEDAAKEAGENKGDDKANTAKQRSDFARAFGSAWSNLVSADYMVVNYLTKTVKAYLTYGDKCLKSAGGDKKEEAPAKTEEPKKKEKAEA